MENYFLKTLAIYGKPFSKTCILVFGGGEKENTVQSGNFKASD